MKLIFGILLTVSLFPSACLGEEDDLKVCAAGGYFSGADDKFLRGLAEHILIKKGVFESSACGAIWRNAYAIGVKSMTRNFHPDGPDREVLKLQNDFRDRVYDSIVKIMK